MLKLVTRILAIMLFVLPAQAQEELQIRDIEKGTGEEANVGETVVVHYTGWLWGGATFDSSWGRGAPISFGIARGSLIDGWVDGIVGQPVGSQLLLVVPPEKGYGDMSMGPIPGGSTLVFAVDVLEAR